MKRISTILGVSFAALQMSGMIGPGLMAQIAPAPRAVIPADQAPEAMTEMFGAAGQAARNIDIPGAKWLQLQFEGADLRGGTLAIRSGDGEIQTFTAEQLAAWEGLSAVFNGENLTVSIEGGAEGASVDIADIIVGLSQGQAESSFAAGTLGKLADTLGPDISRFIAEDPVPVPRSAEAAGFDPDGYFAESICGANDDRNPSSHPFSGRIMPIGCTGWIIEGGAILTAGHCISASTQTLEFDVPASDPDGSTNAPPVASQYKIITSSIVDDYTGVGNDWAVFRVQPNTQTGLMPFDAQGGGFTPSNTASPAAVSITGYGVDGPPPNFGNPPPRNADNQTLQQHSGAVVAPPNPNALAYTADTQGGNSGSPVHGFGTNVAIGIHTNGGCFSGGGSNKGTSFKNAALWTEVEAAMKSAGGNSAPAWIKLLLGN